MDIQVTQSKPLQNTNVSRSSPVNNKVKFHEYVMIESKKEVSGRLTDLMKAIETQGNRLSQSQTVDNLRRYKRQVKEYMNYVKNTAIKLENKEEFNSFGHSKSLQTIKKVDEKLIELTDEILKKEKDSGLRVLELIGEVKGMLIDLKI